jgi:hypothetical protein
MSTHLHACKRSQNSFAPQMAGADAVVNRQRWTRADSAELPAAVSQAFRRGCSNTPPAKNSNSVATSARIRAARHADVAWKVMLPGALCLRIFVVGDSELIIAPALCSRDPARGEPRVITK